MKENIQMIKLPPEPKYTMHPFGEGDETIVINLPERPNWWIRFWMFTFFGWRFRPI